MQKKIIKIIQYNLFYQSFYREKKKLDFLSQLKLNNYDI